MTCDVCGAHIPDGSPLCPQCKGVQEGMKMNDQVTETSPVLLPRTVVYGTPLSLSSPSSSSNKKNLRTILFVGGVAALMMVSLMTFVLFNAFTVFQQYMKQIYTHSSAPVTFNPYTKRTETLIISDPLHDNSIGDHHGYQWMDDIHDGDPGSVATKGCYFADQKYHVSTNGQNAPGAIIYCITAGTRFSNFTYQVQMSVQQGHMGGIIFRQSPHAHFYAFMISSTGNYVLFSSLGSGANLLASGRSHSINQKPGMSNVLAVVANGSKLDLYINQQQVTSVTDSTYSVGIIGMIAMGDDAHPSTDIAYSDAKIWIPLKS